ncbi:hypothetical protein CEY16_13105 [Halalkalibacillus sediminis]|uniref:Uncharacterized protein n=1 Tax=Halalkalibacillus sediminis TaxID=2018042 RepID=A0A2I0QQY6_9BACI|nr:hypothetical protein [Halalkalibacillus sediminis]PKR76752.1 hypothetical protein CEY16_13105 [Halalkalibacillus sediminis]
MTQENKNESKKKLSMQEIVQQQLERKKQSQQAGKNQQNAYNSNHRMESQHVKRASGTPRKMG